MDTGLDMYSRGYVFKRRSAECDPIGMKGQAQ